MGLSLWSAKTHAIFSEQSVKDSKTQNPTAKVKKPVVKKLVAKKAVSKKGNTSAVVKVAKNGAPKKSPDAKSDSIKTSDLIAKDGKELELNQQNSAGDGNLGQDLLNTFLKNDFPEKTDFIEKEDQKTGEKLGQPKVGRSSNTTKSAVKNEQILDDTMTSMFTKMGLMILVLVAVIFSLAFIWKFIQKKSGKLFKGQQAALQIVSQQVIGPKSKILIVEALGKKYLVGATESQIQLIADMDFYEMGGDVEKSGTQSSSQSTFDFAHTLNKNTTPEKDSQYKPKPKDEGQSSEEVRSQAAKRIKDKLKQMKRLS